MLQDMLSAVLYLHNHGIVHRYLRISTPLCGEECRTYVSLAFPPLPPLVVDYIYKVSLSHHGLLHFPVFGYTEI